MLCFRVGTNTTTFATVKKCFTAQGSSYANNMNTLSDVIFIQDATASQQPYINLARDQISKICNTLKATGNFANPNDLRFGVTAFRDHPPQEQSFVTMKFPFTSDINTVANNLACFAAMGGGGGPEAQSDALSDVLRAPWNNNTTKVAVLITDSPPHGIGEANDAFPNGGPLRKTIISYVTVTGSITDAQIEQRLSPFVLLRGWPALASSWYVGLL